MIYHPLLQAPLRQAISWALLQFLWQGSLLALLLLAARGLMRTASASTRYAAACIVLLAMAVTFSATVLHRIPQPTVLQPNPGTASIPIQPMKTHESVTGPAPAPPASPSSTLPDWISYAWLLGVASLSLYTALGLARVHVMKRDALLHFDTECLQSLQRRLGISRAVDLYTSAIARVPTVIGWLRPAILLPVTALTGLTDSQLEAILAHELAHIRRHDYLVNLLQTAVETLLFYHPAVWWVSRQIRQEREHCCDDIAVSLCGDPVAYASALAEMEEIRASLPHSAPPEPALAATGGDLLARIRRILGEPTPGPRPIGALAALALLIAGPALVALRAAPQDAKPAQFEVASVKQLDQSLQPGQADLSFVGTSGKPFKISGNRIVLNGTLHKLIADAYAVKDYQVAGAPSWADSLMFNITAESPGADPPTQDQARLMLQPLLADRFQLKFHRESKELPVYHLVQSKSSKKFTPATGDETFSWKLTQEPGGPMRSKATKESIGDFVQLVGVSADRPVIDKTGITGYIDYDILIEPPGGLRAPGEGEGRGQKPPVTPEDTNRAILAAVTDQLGLKLESAKDAVDILVIDSVDKPSAN